MAAIINALFDKSLLYIISPYDAVAHVQALIGTEMTYDHPWVWSLVSVVIYEWFSTIFASKSGFISGGDLRMIPDVSQHGSAETTEWKPVENTPVIMFDRVSKSYGRINAMNSVSLGISGGVTGILGMNGAGKSTLFKLMMGKIKPSSGAIRLFGTGPWKNPAPYSRVGFVPEHEKMYDWMTAFDFVTTFARLHGMTREEASKEATRVLSFVSLGDVMHKRIGQFSKGMRQRVKIAHALVNDPELIILTSLCKAATHLLEQPS